MRHRSYTSRHVATSDARDKDAAAAAAAAAECPGRNSSMVADVIQPRTHHQLSTSRPPCRHTVTSPSRDTQDDDIIYYT